MKQITNGEDRPDDCTNKMKTLFTIFSAVKFPVKAKTAYVRWMSMSNLTISGSSTVADKEWCCVVEGRYKSPCQTCPLSEAAQEYFRFSFASSGDWKGTMNDHQKQKRSNWHSRFSNQLTGNLSEVKARAVLGLSDNAFESVTVEDIKKAFKRGAMALHPDKDGGSEQKFVELVEAYEYLLSISKRY